jgi:hypothetical protein
MKRKSGKGIYTEKQLRKYRIDKRRPRRGRQETTDDMGDHYEKTVRTWPPNTTTEKRWIPKIPNGNWLRLWDHVIKVRYSKLQGRYYLFDRQDNYLGELSQSDLFNLSVAVLSSIGAFREEIHKNRKGQTWIVHTVKSFSRLKSELST